MSEEAEIINEITPIEASVIFQQDSAIIDRQITTAKAFPRNLPRVVKAVTDIVSMDIDTAVSCVYSVPRGGKSITGPSVHLAKIAVQQYGNIRAEARVIAIEEFEIISEGICWDLETNVAIKSQVRRSIRTKAGKRFQEDMITVTGNAANSIALRNAIYNVLPRPLIDKAYQAAQKTITGDISDATKLKTAARKAIDTLMATYNVNEAEVLNAIGRNSVDNVTGDDIVVLRGIWTALKDGDTTVEQAFRPSADKDPAKNYTYDQMVVMQESVDQLKAVKSPDEFQIAFDNLYKDFSPEQIDSVGVDGKTIGQIVADKRKEFEQ